ncbi:MAG: redoxin domain-containing protein [Nitrosopumilus sp.]|nr:redoxin domain-containing protein [Nitrosopumilus sp.]
MKEIIEKAMSMTQTDDEKKTTDKSQFKLAPEFEKSGERVNINSNSNGPQQPITMASLKGKVVLVNFWTYSCINVLRTLPHLMDWDAKYADKGLVIVGVHTPEFEFEKDVDNVEKAIHRYGINYPILQDNNHKTWNAYANNYWPRMYLVDDIGHIRYDKVGEGDYNQTEKVIQSLLSERNTKPTVEPKESDIAYSHSNKSSLHKPNNISSFLSQSVDFSKIKTHELYFGHQSPSSSLGNSDGFHPGKNVTYTIPPKSSIKPNTIYLEGQWKNNPDNMEFQGDTGGRIILNYTAKSVNLVAGGKGNGTVYEDGAFLSNNSRGIDLGNDSKFTIDGPRLYNIVNHQSYSGSHLLVIDVKGTGFQAYTFTFG